MPEPQHNPGICLYGAEALRELLGALTAEIEGVRAAVDIEYIHRMRVASRRLRAALAIFAPCLPKKRATGWTREIRRITRALGAARDTDVQLDFLVDFLSNEAASREKAGLRRILLRLQQQRTRLQRDVLKALEELERGKAIPEMQAELQRIITLGQQHAVDAAAPAVQHWAAIAVAARLDEFLAYESAVTHPERLEELHAMRIAAKRLRYTMQLFSPLFPEVVKSALSAARKIQDTLGDFHDCDVWVTFITAFQQEERTRTIKYYGHTRTFYLLQPGFSTLRDNRLAMRDQRYREFADYWRRITEKELWTTLRAELAGFLIAEVVAPTEDQAEGLTE